jgi:hypothetical protein
MSGAPTIESQREAVAERKAAADKLKAVRAARKAELENAAATVTDSVAEAAQATKDVVAESVADVKKAVE